MESKAKIAGHPVHPMLIAFPLGLLATSFIFDLIHLASGSERLGFASFYMIAAGILSGLLAAVFGLVDWLAIPHGTRARRVGLLHGVGNVVVVVLFAVSWAIRYADPGRAGGGAVVVSLLGVLLALVTGWLGGELVDRLGIGISANAHPDAPSSLHDSADDHRPAHPRSA
jgi:uncharacterized membrane protein